MIGKDVAPAGRTHEIGRIVVLVVATLVFAAAWSSNDRDGVGLTAGRSGEQRTLPVSLRNEPYEVSARATDARYRRRAGTLSSALHAHARCLQTVEVRRDRARVEATLGGSLYAGVIEPRPRRDVQIFSGTPALLGGSWASVPALAVQERDDGGRSE